jgi:hypothetical protein
VLPAAGGGVQQPQVVTFLARRGETVEPGGDVAAVGVDSGDVGAAAELAGPAKPPANPAAKVGQGERGQRLGAGQDQAEGKGGAGLLKGRAGGVWAENAPSGAATVRTGSWARTTTS